MADLDKQIQKALGKKGAATKKQAKLSEQIAKQETEIAELQKKKLNANKIQSRHLRGEIFDAQQFLKQLKTASSRNQADIRTYTTSYKKYKRELDKITKAEQKAQDYKVKQTIKHIKESTRLEARRAAQEQREWNRQALEANKWAKNRAGNYGLSGRFDKKGKYSGSASWSGKFKAGEDLMARQGIQNAIAKMKKRGDYKGLQSVNFSQNADGTISTSVSADVGNKGEAISKIKAVANKLASVIEFVVDIFKKLIKGIRSIIKSLWDFSKKLVKIGLGLPLFNVLFSKLASLNGLNKFEFIGNIFGKGKGNGVRATSKLEQMYGTDGSLMGMFENRFSIFNSPAYRKGLASLGILGNTGKMNKLQNIGDAFGFGSAMFDEIKGWMQKEATARGTTIEDIIKNPAAHLGLGEKYEASGLSQFMSIESFAKYLPVMGKMRQTYGNEAFQRQVVTNQSLKSEVKYQTSLLKWENFWIKLATKLEPYMSKMSDDIVSVADAFADMLFNNGGFKYLANTFMHYFDMLCNWLKKDGRNILDKAFNWLGEKIKEFVKWIDDPNNMLKKYWKQAEGWMNTPDENGNTGIGKIFAIIKQVGDYLWDFGQTVGTIIDIMLFIPRKIVQAGEWVGEKIFGPSFNAVKEFLEDVGHNDLMMKSTLASRNGGKRPDGTPLIANDAITQQTLSQSKQTTYSPNQQYVTFNITLDPSGVRDLFTNGKLKQTVNLGGQ